MENAVKKAVKAMEDMVNSFRDYLKETLESGWCGYDRAGRRYIAPCGAAHRCQRRGWTCKHIGDCGRIPSAKQKAELRLHVVEWPRIARKGLRKRQLLKCYTRYYGRVHARNKPPKNGGAKYE